MIRCHIINHHNKITSPHTTHPHPPTHPTPPTAPKELALLAEATREIAACELTEFGPLLQPHLPLHATITAIVLHGEYGRRILPWFEAGRGGLCVFWGGGRGEMGLSQGGWCVGKRRGGGGGCAYRSRQRNIGHIVCTHYIDIVYTWYTCM